MWVGLTRIKVARAEMLVGMYGSEEPEGLLFFLQGLKIGRLWEYPITLLQQKK